MKRTLIILAALALAPAAASAQDTTVYTPAIGHCRDGRLAGITYLVPVPPGVRLNLPPGLCTSPPSDAPPPQPRAPASSPGRAA